MNQNPGPGQQWGHPGQGGFPPGGFPPGGFPRGGYPPGGPAQKKSGTGLSCLVIGLIATPILALVGMGALGALFYFIGAPSSPGPAMTASAAAPGRGELTVNDSDVAQSMGLGEGTDCKVNVNTDLVGDKVKEYGLLRATSKTLYAEWTPDSGARRAGSLRMRIVEGKVSGSGNRPVADDTIAITAEMLTKRLDLTSPTGFAPGNYRFEAYLDGKLMAYKWFTLRP